MVRVRVSGQWSVVRVKVRVRVRARTRVGVRVRARCSTSTRLGSAATWLGLQARSRAAGQI